MKRILCLLLVYFPMNSSNSTGTTRMEKGRKKLYIAKICNQINIFLFAEYVLPDFML